MGFSYDDNDDVILKGPDGTPIGNVGDRMKVDATVTVQPGSGYSVLPKESVVNWNQRVAENGGSSEELNVDGSTTAVSYRITPSSGEIWYATRANISIEDPGANDTNKFGSEPELTNGLLIRYYVDGNYYTLATITNNLQLAEVFSQGSSVTGGAPGFLNTANAFIGNHVFDIPITLSQARGDYVEVLVQDNLTDIRALHISFGLMKEVS